MCCCAGSARYNLVAAVKSKTNVMAAILPGKFDDGDFDAWLREFDAWLREFDACSAANGWQVTEDKDDKILKLPAFLRGRAASNFYAIPEGERRTYKDAVKSMRRALWPQAKREKFFAEFEQRHLRPEEDPSVYKWELENTLTKANPSLSTDGKTALLTRQFSKGLPPTIKLKMLEHNPTPSLDEMVEFTQWFRALCCPTVTEPRPVHVDAVSSSPSDPQLKELFTMVAGIAAKQQALEDRLKIQNILHGRPLVPRRLAPVIRVVYQAIFLEDVRVDHEVLSLGGTSIATTVENQGTSRESVDQRVL